MALSKPPAGVARSSEQTMLGVPEVPFHRAIEDALAGLY